MGKITWADKVTLNPQPSISAENKVTDADMNEIKNVVNGNDTNVGDLTDLNTTDKSSIVNAINEVIYKDIYSTTEVLTNKAWLNGKPIYKKVVSVNFPTGAGTTTITHNISNIEFITNYQLIWYDTFDHRWFNNFKDTTGDFYIEIDGISSTSIQVKAVGNLNWNDRTSDRYCIVEYTKTTN